MKFLLVTTLYFASAIAAPNHYTSQTQIMKDDGEAPTTPNTNILVTIGLMKGDPVHATCAGEFEFCSPMNNIPCCDNRICTYCRGDAGGRTICHNNACHD